MKPLFSILMLAAVCYFFGCKEKDTIYTNTITGVDAKPGSIIGYVVYNTGMQQYPYPGVSVSISGTSFTAITDTNGRYSLNDGPPGTYDINMYKIGYDTMTIYAFSYAGNGNGYAGDSWLSEISKFSFSSIKESFVQDTGNASTELFTIQWTDPDFKDTLPNYIPVTLFFSNQPNVDYNHYLTWGMEYYDGISITKTTYLIPDRSDNLNQFFKKGETVYVIAYPDQEIHWVICTDPRTNISRYKTVPNPSPVASFVMQ